MIRELLEQMKTQGWVISATQAAELGVNRQQRRTLLRSGVLLEVRRGIDTCREHWDSEDHVGRHRIALAGALLARSWSPTAPSHRHVGGLRTAAFLLGLPFQPDAELVDALNQEFDLRNLSPEARAVQAELAQIRRGEGPRRIDLVCADRSRRTYAHGVNVRPATLPREHVVLNHGVPLTSLARTAVDLMREGTESDAVIAGDGALHLGLERSDLEQVVGFCSRWSNGHQAVEALAFANGLAESAAESLARWTCAQEKKIPAPELQVDLYDVFGWIARVDMLFRRFRVVLEVDGLVKYTDPWCGDAEEALRRQHAREARLRTAGWTVVRTTWEELVTNPAAFINRLLAALAEGS
ncbi:MAG TPA: hypothetical protein VMZ00_04345 [Sporichthya sp.]|nr:hypothetical protein [Sporichthya sp.]